MDEELRAALDAMEGRLMGRINDSYERVADRLAATDGRLANLERAVDGLIEVGRSTNTLLGAIASSLSDIAGRVTRLENKA